MIGASRRASVRASTSPRSRPSSPRAPLPPPPLPARRDGRVDSRAQHLRRHHRRREDRAALDVPRAAAGCAARFMALGGRRHSRSSPQSCSSPRSGLPPPVARAAREVLSAPSSRPCAQMRRDYPRFIEVLLAGLQAHPQQGSRGGEQPDRHGGSAAAEDLRLRVSEIDRLAGAEDAPIGLEMGSRTLARLHNRMDRQRFSRAVGGGGLRLSGSRASWRAGKAVVLAAIGALSRAGADRRIRVRRLEGRDWNTLRDAGRRRRGSLRRATRAPPRGGPPSF